jgi:hypothetical protein
MTTDEQMAWLAKRHPTLRVPCTNGAAAMVDGHHAEPYHKSWGVCRSCGGSGYTLTTDLAVVLKALNIDNDRWVSFEVDYSTKKPMAIIKHMRGDDDPSTGDNYFRALVSAFYQAEGGPDA